IDVLRPPAGIAPRAAAVADVAREIPDRRGQAHLEPRIAALEPVVQAVRVPVHRGPALQREIGNQENSGHGRAVRGARCGVSPGAWRPTAVADTPSEATAYRVPRTFGSAKQVPPARERPLRHR